MTSEKKTIPDDFGKPGGEENPQYLMTYKQLSESLGRVMSYAEVGDNGEVKEVSRQRLADIAGISKRTLAKFFTSENVKDGPPNPTLDVICRLAHALNISPALLLMTADDWNRLANASTAYAQALVQSPEFREMAANVTSNEYDGKPKNVIKDSLHFAEKVFTRREVDPKRVDVVSTSQALPFSRLEPSSRAFLLVTCAVFALGTPARPLDSSDNT